MQKLFLSSLMLFFMGLTNYAQNLDLKPGVDRWSIKTSTVVNVKTVPITDLLQLSNPITDYHKTEYGDKRIPTIVQPDSLKEGDIVTTTAWLHLVALERASDTHRDGDYHIQITNSPEWGDSCFIIEVPYPDFVEDPYLKTKCAEVREFIRNRLLKGKEPGTTGNIMQHEVYVTVTGQLFFDATHLKGNPRGKKGMKSYTAWEIHPLFSIAFAPKPVN